MDGFTDDYNDATGVDLATSTNEVRDSANYYSGVLINNGPAIDGYIETLFHGDGANSGTTFTDSSSNNFSVTSSGNIVTSTTSPKFGTASIHVPSTANDYIYWGANSSSLHLDANPFTISFWIKTTTSSAGTIFGRNNGSAGQHNFDVALQITSSGLMDMVINTNTEYANAAQTITAVNDGDWHHVEFCRSGSNILSFVDGVGEGLTAVTSNSVINRESSAFYLGYMNGGHYTGAICYIDELEFSPGIARHTSTFTPPTAPWGGTDENYNNMTLQSNAFTAQADPTTARIILDEASAAGSTTLDTDLKAYASRDNGTTFTQMPLVDQGNLISINQGGIDSNTKLMLHCDGANDGTTFTDSSDSPHTVTAVGSVHTDTAVKKFGTASAQFDGAGDQLTVPSSSDWNPYDISFTADFWLYVSSFNDNYDWILGNTGANYYGWNIQLEKSNTTLNFLVGSGSGWAINTAGGSGYAISTGTWYHIALVKNGTAWALYVDGTSRLTGTSAATDYDKHLTGWG